MEAKTRKRLDRVITEALELAGSGVDEFEAARQALTAQTTDVLRELAIAALVDTIRRRQRSGVLSIERDAERSRTAQESGGQTPEQRATFDRLVRDAEERHLAIQRAHAARMARIIDDFKREVFVEWTAELLASDFAMPDGTRVTWGEATIEQHEERAAMFQRNAVANAEGAARHVQAVEQLKDSGALTLSDLVGVAA